MFKIIILDIAQLFPKIRSIYHLFKEITRFKGSAKKLEELIKKEYEELILGLIKEDSFFKTLKDVTKSKRMINSLKIDLFTKFKPAIPYNIIQLIRENFKIIIIGDFFENWWREIKRRNKIVVDYELFSNNTKVLVDNYSFFESIQKYFNISIQDAVLVSDNPKSIKTAKMIGSKIVNISSNKVSEADFNYDSLNNFAEVIS